MKNILLYYLFFLFLSCLNSSKKTEKLEEFIYYSDSVYPDHSKEMFYAFSARKQNDTNYLVLRTKYYYDPNFHIIVGYFFR